MNEINQLKKLMEAVDDGAARTEPWEYNVEEFMSELRAFANLLPDSHHRDQLLRIISEGSIGLMDRVKAFAAELSDPYYGDWLELIMYEYNKPVTEEANDTYDQKTGEWSRSGRYDDVEDDSMNHNDVVKEDSTDTNMQELSAMSVKYDFEVTEYYALVVYAKGTDDVVGSFDDFDDMISSALNN